MIKSIKTKSVLLFLNLLALFVSFILNRAGVLGPTQGMFVITVVMASSWILELLPLGATALIPLVAFPLLGIMSTKSVAPIYMGSIIWLFIGGFLVAEAMQRWQLHKRLALNIIGLFGGGASGLLLGFMCATGFLSMWISNTASTVLMVSMGLAIIKNYEETDNIDPVDSRAFSSALMLGTAYSATIGGMATIVGTPPNLAFSRIYALSFPGAEEITFTSWMSFGFPLAVILIFLSWFFLNRYFLKGKKIETLGKDLIENEKNKLGKLKSEEKLVMIVFLLMAFLWIFRKTISIGNFSIPGWSTLIPGAGMVDDGTVAIFCALLLFILPSQSQPETRILNSSAFKTIPWETIILFGGGFALAKGIVVSGLSVSLGSQFAGLASLPEWAMVGGLTFGMSLLTEITSNIASTEMLLPILAAIAKSTGVPPTLLMIPATLAASCAFMLPAATAPNAIVFGSSRVNITDMVKVGLMINIVSVVLITIISLFLFPNFS